MSAGTGGAACNCPSCQGAGPIERLLSALGDDRAAARWYESLFGAAPAHIKRDLKAKLGDQTAARRLIEQVGMDAAVPLAILAEAPNGIPLATLAFETVALIGAAATGGLQRLAQMGLVFELRSFDYQRVQGEPLRVLPQPLADWLRPVLSGLLVASTPSSALPAASAAAAPGASDAHWPDAMELAAVATIRPRLTSGRLYKKDSERLGALLATAGLTESPDRMIDRLRRLRLVRFVHDDAAERIEPDWKAVSAWAAWSPQERARRRLALGHAGSPLWSLLMQRPGAWVEEIHLARQFRIGRRLVPDPGTVSSTSERFWSFERERTLAIWPEAERGEYDGTPFWRIRHEHARAGATAPAAPPAKAHVQPDFEILAPRDMALADVALLARVAELRRADVVATFVLTAASARRAVGRGMPAAEICKALHAIAAHGVPPTLERAVKDWTGDMGRCTVRTVVLATFDEPSIADRALAVLGNRAERLSPTCLAVPGQDADADEIERRLTSAAMAPRHEDGRVARLFDDDSDDDDDDRWNSLPRSDAPAPPDALWLEKLHALRTNPAAHTAPLPAHTASKGVRLPAPAAVQRALTFGADLLVEIGGNRTTIRPLGLAGPPSAPAVEATIAGRPGTQLLRLDEIETAVLLPATARAVSRNAPCPCGSGRKFKRCCLDTPQARPA